jgi:glycosyltransferase involved in cell wall biosynthesis
VTDTRVSAIVPVHNGERYLGEALDSILAQTAPVAEILVVDDGSTDGSADVARGYGDAVRYLRQPNQGAGVARNTGAAAALGTHLAFLDADDLWTPDKTRAQLEVLLKDPDCDAVFGQVRQFHSPELPEAQAGLRPPNELVAGYHPGAMLVRREAFERVGLFESRWAVGEFLNWYLRGAEQGLRTGMLDEVVMLRRIHGANTTAARRQSYVDYVRALKASLDRRRAAGRDEPGPADGG